MISNKKVIKMEKETENSQKIYMRYEEQHSDFNPWLMANIERMELHTIDTPSGWLEWDND